MTTADPSDQVATFIADLPPNERTDLELELSEFVLYHASHHRPIALVSSGGTAADLEVNSVRSLDNFSTGLRGAISVEEFLRRGYAVIHLWRRGSSAPFARVLSTALDLTPQANHGLSVDSLGKLFAGDHAIGEDNYEEAMVQQVLDQEDPWLTDPNNTNNNTASLQNSQGGSATSGMIALHRHVLYSTRLQTALQERSTALKEKRFLTIPFRTIEEYLAKLQIAATALQANHSLALFYLAAAVSDYYIPKEEKSQHKIQSQEGGNETGITLQLRPVPKTMGLLRHTWAPDSFLVSFKLETDISILRRKAEKAVQKYGCHLVIGNILQTRHSKVWVLCPPEGELGRTNDNNNSTTEVKDWPFQEVSKPQPQHYASASSDHDSLESAIIDFVVQSHFEFISHQGFPGTTSTEMDASIVQRQADLEERKRQLKRQALEAQLKRHAFAIAGTVIAVVLSSAISSALHRRAASSRR